MASTINGSDNFTTIQKGTINNPFKSAFDAYREGVAEGLYYFINQIGTVQQLYYADGWVLVSSNNASYTDIPSGTGRNNVSYTLTRGGAGPLGTPDPDKDYIIGDFLTNFSYFEAKLFAFGRSSTNGTYTYANNNYGTHIMAIFPIYGIGDAKRTSPMYNSAVTRHGNMRTSVNYWSLDGVAMDISYNANSNQSTVGIVATNTTDPSDGTYVGHGTSEGPYEGWYDTSGAADCQGYTSWVR
jgi:hypothetical protein